MNTSLRARNPAEIKDALLQIIPTAPVHLSDAPAHYSNLERLIIGTYACFRILNDEEKKHIADYLTLHAKFWTQNNKSLINRTLTLINELTETDTLTLQKVLHLFESLQESLLNTQKLFKIIDNLPANQKRCITSESDLT